MFVGVSYEVTSFPKAKSRFVLYVVENSCSLTWVSAWDSQSMIERGRYGSRTYYGRYTRNYCRSSLPVPGMDLLYQPAQNKNIERKEVSMMRSSLEGNYYHTIERLYLVTCDVNSGIV